MRRALRASFVVAGASLSAAAPASCAAESASSPDDGCERPRPIAGPLPFEDATEAWSLDFRHHAATGLCDMLDTVGGPGVCAFDADGDGDVDLYFTDRAPHPNRLLRNDGGRFTDVTEASGAGVTTDSHACLAFDHDGDGDVDLFVGNSGADQLLANDGTGAFTDVSAATGIASESGFTTTATAGDIDADGDLDLFVGHFVDPATCPSTCWPSPSKCEPLANALFVNDGGAFHEAAAERGIDGAEPTLSSLFFDADADGDLDLFAGNDLGYAYPDRLYRNDGAGFFADAADEMGLDFPGTDTMGVDVGDADGDGTLDVIVSDYREVPIRLATCPEGAPCEVVGIDEASTASVKWSIALADFDQDADLDVFTVTGNTVLPEGYVGDRPQLHWNDGHGLFTHHAPSPGDPLAAHNLARGAAFADIDGDLDLDVVIANLDRPARLLLNRAASGRALLVELDSLSAGARVTVTPRGQGPSGQGTSGQGTSGAGGAGAPLGPPRTEQALLGGSYAGSSDPRVHFGLGGACSADVTVTWPDGHSRAIDGAPAGQLLHIDR